EAAVLAESRAEVELVLRLAREHRVPVTPRGTGTGLTGGCLPVRGGIVLSTERMARIKEIDGDDLLAVVEPGVLTGDLQAAAEAAGLFYPPDPASLQTCTLGGNVAENAGGPRAFKYGVTREYVLGLEAVLMGGETIACGRRTSKGVTGYDVVGAIVGSEGTFAVATELTLKLLPRPAAVATFLAVFADAFVAGAAVSTVLKLGARPRALELLDRATIEHLRGRTPYRLPEGAGALVLVELDGEPEGLDAQLERCAAACERAGAVDVVVAQNEQQRRDLWETRRRANPTLKMLHRTKIPEDIVVPRGAIPEMLRRVDEVAAAEDVPQATYGHAGDGNLHINLLLDDDDPAVRARADRAVARIMRATLDLRGTLAGEHGVGLMKQKFLDWEQSPPLIRLQRKLKAVFDPDDLLNPGKILPAP
ncbi:MAG TPA: FAD-linked oxidase C-terminal domain-containing protein, partial [Polyangia bacterium]|nr:FAD-linked oxidase C-terminal domain-containing protein [Polyangia bacterium]